jgi:glycosyltransferase involved in cell wall biosynthesis
MAPECTSGGEKEGMARRREGGRPPPPARLVPESPRPWEGLAGVAQVVRQSTRTYVHRVRIAMVSTPFVAVPPPAYGGTELVVDTLTRALERAGHEVTVFATGDSQARHLRALFPQPVWPPDPHSELLHCRFAAREIRAGAYDVIHAHAPSMLAFAPDLRPPMVYTLHHEQLPGLTAYYRRIEGVRFIAISARQMQLSDPPAQHVVHHGLDPDLYPEVGPGGDAAFFLGRLSPVKAPDVAIEAARRAGLPLVVAGKFHSMDDEPGWQEKIDAALAASHVRWLKNADLATKRRLFARSRALLVPLRWEEPFGLVVIEALLAGCPVIASPRGAVPEIVEDGATGFLVRSVREMAAALRRAARLDRAAIQARARERFSSDVMAERYLEVYRSARAEHAWGRRARPPLPGETGWTTLVQ